jgi:pentapeptide MXKDX repeat protein
MNKLLTMVFAGCIAAAGVPALAASHAGAQKDDMKKDGMMKKDEMKKDGMMKKDEMKKDGMMKKDEMKKDEMMKK